MQEESESKHPQEVQVEGRWTQQEHERFLAAIVLHGKNWKLIQTSVQTRNTSQVRSHAQKFFLKLLKIEKERKKNEKKGINEVSRSQEQIIKSLKEQSFTSNTPLEIIHFLKKDYKQIESKSPIQASPSSRKSEMKQRTPHILQQMMDCNQDSSFLLSLIKRNKGLLRQEEGFTELINFPQMQEENNEETANKRKKSFSLYDQEEDPAKYDGAVKKMRNFS